MEVHRKEPKKQQGVPSQNLHIALLERFGQIFFAKTFLKLQSCRGVKHKVHNHSVIHYKNTKILYTLVGQDKGRCDDAIT